MTAKDKLHRDRAIALFLNYTFKVEYINNIKVYIWHDYYGNIVKGINFNLDVFHLLKAFEKIQKGHIREEVQNWKTYKCLINNKGYVILNYKIATNLCSKYRYSNIVYQTESLQDNIWKAVSDFCLSYLEILKNEALVYDIKQFELLKEI